MRDRAEQFADRGAVIIGASFDTVAENRDFAAAQEFPFVLVSDVDRTVGAAYEVTRDADDKFAAYPRRFSYLIDRAGVVRRSYDVTDVATHADDVLADIDRLEHRP